MIWKIVFFTSFISHFGINSGGLLWREEYETTNVPDSDVKIQKAPYLASINCEGEFICPGVILGLRWILTTTSCVDGYVPGELEVRTGSSQTDTGGRVDRVINIISRENFNSSNMNEDVAILQLGKDLDLGPRTLAIRIAHDKQPPRAALKLSTWSVDSGLKTKVVKQFSMMLEETGKCQQKYGSDNITDSMFCAVADGPGPCWGDFGAPIVNKWHALVGLYSWSKGCDELPAVFTNVTALKPWIISHACIL